MKKYLVLYKAPIEATNKMGHSTPEQQAAGAKAWSDWAKKTGENLVSIGQPLSPNAVSVTISGSKTADLEITGFSIVQAESLEEAQKLLHGHPHLTWHPACSIELYEARPLPEM